MRSMTGYGRGVYVDADRRIYVEIRSVNRRQAEFGFRLPRELDALEPRLRELLARAISRGRVDVTVTLENVQLAIHGRIDFELASAFTSELNRLGRELHLVHPTSQGEGWVTLEALLRCPGVIVTNSAPMDSEIHWPGLSQALAGALREFNSMRDREGSHLDADLTQRIEILRQSVQRVREIAPEVQRRFRELLLQKIRGAGIETISPDDDRVLKEVVIYSDRSDVAEELARLESHFEQFNDCRNSSDAVGRKLDFLAQEMNREINTIGSKANDARISVEVVLLKTELERFREQAQNVE